MIGQIRIAGYGGAPSSGWAQAAKRSEYMSADRREASRGALPECVQRVTSREVSCTRVAVQRLAGPVFDLANINDTEAAQRCRPFLSDDVFLLPCLRHLRYSVASEISATHGPTRG